MKRARREEQGDQNRPRADLDLSESAATAGRDPSTSPTGARTGHPADGGDLFGGQALAQGYADSRPRFHGQVIAQVRSALGLAPSDVLERALDVGCGAGLSTSPLRELARQVVGVDGSPDMVAVARDEPAVWHLAAAAEHLPFEARSFELVAVSGAINWIDRGRFLPEAHRVLRGSGWLVVYDGAEQGAMAGEPAFRDWYRERYLARLPRPPRDESILSDEEARGAGFRATQRQTYALEWPFDLGAYVEFMLTQSNVTDAVREGRESVDGVRGWLCDSLAPLFGEGERGLLFGGYIWILERNA